MARFLITIYESNRFTFFLMPTKIALTKAIPIRAWWCTLARVFIDITSILIMHLAMGSITVETHRAQRSHPQSDLGKGPSGVGLRTQTKELYLFSTHLGTRGCKGQVTCPLESGRPKKCHSSIPSSKYLETSDLQLEFYK